MVWIDNVLEYEANGGTTQTILKNNGFYFSQDRIRESSFIEFTAQAYAFCNLAHLRTSGTTDAMHSRTYLAAVKDFRFHNLPKLNPGDVVITKVKKTRAFGPITLVTGSCFVDDQFVASCELKVFSE
jgi:3-hydroxymyristoyl/3-hydroxydecanoyl-(acyl carrier protein) dehydratase